jgi:hypothetical protein
MRREQKKRCELFLPPYEYVFPWPISVINPANHMGVPYEEDIVYYPDSTGFSCRR